MDILEDFKPFLKQWCKTNHKPLPPENKQNTIWRLAWEEYMKTILVDRWEETRDEYKNMKLLTKRDLRNQEIKKKQQQALKEEEGIEEEATEPQVEEKPLSDWEKVQRMLK